MHPATYSVMRDASGGYHANLPVLVPMRDAPAAFGLSRSALYRLAGEGRIEFRKHGRSTLVLTESVLRAIAELPPAPIRAPRRNAA